MLKLTHFCFNLRQDRTRQRIYLCPLNCIIKYKFINKNKMDF